MKSQIPHRFFPFFFILYEFACNLSNDLYLPALPEIANQFSTHVSNMGFTIAAWLAGDACIQWLLGPLCDRFGQRTVLFCGGILFCLSTIGCAVSQNLAFMLIARFGQGIGVSSMMIAGYACIHSTYSDQQAVKMLAAITSVSIIAPMVGPLLGGWLMLWLDWRWLFIVILTLALFSLLGLWFFMPTMPHHAEEGLHSEKVLKSYGQLLKNKEFILRASSLGLIYAAIISWITASPAILMADFQLSSLAFGLSQCPIFGSYIVGAQIGQRLMTCQSSPSIIRGGLKITLAAIILLLLSHFITREFWGIIVGMSILLFGAGMVCPPLNRACFQSSTQNKGITSAMFYTTLMVMGTFCSALISVSKVNHILPLSVLIAITVLLSWVLYQRSENYATNRNEFI